MTYIYQVASDAAFTDVLINEPVGRETVFRALTQAQWVAFLNGQPQRTLYQRLIVSDGQTAVTGPAFEVTLALATGPIVGQVTIPTPNYRYQGVFATLGAGFRVYDIAIDEQTGRVWACTLSHGPYVYNADGTPYRLTDPAIGYGVDEFGNEFVNAFSFNGASFNDGTCYGVEYDPAGYVYLAVDGDLFKLDAFTGRPVAFWDSASGFGFETNPSLSSDGRILGHDVFPGNRGFILRRSLVVPTGFDIVRDFNSANPPQLLVSGSVSRSSAFSPEGDRIYLPPTASSRNVAIYSSSNGLDWTREEDFLMPAPTGADAIYAGPNQQIWVINERSAFPPNLIYVDFQNQFTWNLFLEQIEESDLRGFTVSRDGRTFYVGGAQALYKYEVAAPNTVQDPPVVSLAQATAINSSGEALRAGQRVEVTVIATTDNLSSGGLEFYAEDATGEIKLFSGGNPLGYVPGRGDRIRVVGLIEQSLGQIQLIPESITRLAIEQPLRGRPLVTGIGEAEESKVVVMRGLSLVDPARWTTGTGFNGFSVTADGQLCGVTENAPAVELFIDRETDLYAKPPPHGCVTAVGVVQQRGSGYVLTPLGLRWVGLEGSVEALLLRRFLPGTGDLASFLARPVGLRVPFNKQLTWFTNGVEAQTNHPWSWFGKRTFQSRSLQAGDLIYATVEIPSSPYPYISNLIELGLGPVLIADTTDNAPGQPIQIDYAANPAWASEVEEITIDGCTVDPTLYTVTSTRVLFDGSVFAAEGRYRIVVRARGYKPVRVTQLIETLAPPITADSTDNDLLNAIEITFSDDPAWRGAVTQVLLNGVALDPRDYILEAGRLVIRAGVFPGVGPQTLEVVATGYITRTFTQTIVLSTPPALIADSDRNELGEPIEISFASNPIWQGFVTSVLVNGFDLLPSEYSLSDGLLRLEPTAVPQIREYVITVQAANFRDAVVNQAVRPRSAPVLVADSVDNDIFNPITVQFVDDVAWRSAVLAVLVNGIIQSPSDYTLGAGQLVLASSLFPSPGSYAIDISAGPTYQVAQVIQTVTAPTFTVSGTVRRQAGGPLANVEVLLDELVEMRFDGTLDDTSGNAFSAVPDNIPMTFLVDGARGQVLDFNGTDDLISLSSLRFGGDYSVHLWLNPDVTAGVQGGWSRSFLSYYENADNAFRFALDSSILRASVVTDGQVVGRETSTAFAVTADQWVQMTVVVIRGQSAALYVNGVDAGSVPNAWSRGTDLGLTLGARARGEGHFDGQLDELTIWNRALSAAEVSALAASGRGPRVLTDAAGQYRTTVGFGSDLILKPVQPGLVFSPTNAFLRDIRGNLTQDFDGAGAVTLTVVNPIQDVRTASTANIVIDLGGVMSDPASPSSPVTYALVTVSDPSFLGVGLSGTTLTGAFLDLYGRSTVELQGSANGKSAVDAFSVELDPYCVAQGGGDWEHIFQVTLTSAAGATLIDNPSARSFYSSFRHDSAPAVSRGQTLTLRVAGQDWPSDEVKAWVDWNRDGDFSDPGEETLIGTGRGPENLGTNRGAWSAPLTVPAFAETGKTVLRIRHQDAASTASPNGTPCGPAGFGEIEDYSVTVQP